MKGWQKVLLFYLSFGLVYGISLQIAPVSGMWSREFWRDCFLMIALLEFCSPFYTAAIVPAVIEGLQEWRARRAQEEPEQWTELVIEEDEPEQEHKPEPEKQKADPA